MPQTRIGIIGLGSFSTNYHIPNLLNRPDVDVTAVCDTSESRLNSRAPEIAHSRQFTDYRVLLDSNVVDGIIVSTPNQFHFDACKQAMERDIPVLVDKPITVTSADAEKLVDLSRSRNVILMTAFTRRFMSSTEHVRREIRSNALNIQRITAVQRRSGIVNTIQDGGMLHRRTVHILDVIPWLTGKPIVRISGTIDYENDRVEEHLVDVRLELEDGQIVDLLCIKDCEDVLDEVTIYGSEKSYCLNKQTLYETGFKSGWRLVENLPAQGNSTAHFIDAINGVEFPPEAPYADRRSEDGLRSIRVLETIHEAGRTGTVVEVPARKGCSLEFTLPTFRFLEAWFGGGTSSRRYPIVSIERGLEG